MKKMNTINETTKLCKEHNIGISRNFIRELANSGAIPCVKCGKSILINWEGLMNYLDTNKLSPEKTISGIRKISA